MSRYSPDRFRRVDAIFDAVLDLPEHERAAYLERTCEGDSTLLLEVVALLDSVGEAESLLGENVGDFAGSLIAGWADAPDAPLAEGAVLGPWRILREIGRGGMGAVHLAERADGAFALRVAIKVVKRGMDTVEVLRRFEEERRILATLDHPNVARLIDGGATPDGRPYLVMEYVEGRPIDAWSDAAKLDLRRRVELFRGVCEAVHQAHRRLIVHRDVKPSNVLVTGDGVPKLLDFGIAKLMDAEGSATSTGVRVLTPDYAAPEQLTGEPVTTATDVYALGRLLYELLSGVRPARAAVGPGVQRETVLPSAAVRRQRGSSAGADGLDVAAIAAARATTADRLATLLSGDLDTIVLRAMAPEPARRYASALQLSEDLDRWLRGWPVHARPDNVSYRAAKFIRRHRAGVAGAAVSAVLLVTFAVSMAAAQRRTAEALVRVENERDTAEQVATVLERIFSAGDPTAARRERLDTLRVAALLDRSAATVRDSLADRPAIQARLLRSLGDAYRGLGLFDAADPLLRAAVDAQRPLPDSVAFATALNSLGLLELNRGRSAEAEPWLLESLTIRRRVLDAADRTTVQTLSNLAAARQDQGDYESAAALYDEALGVVESVAPPDSGLLSTVLNGRAMLAQRTGDFATAAAFSTRILAIDRARLGMEHPRVAIDLFNVGLMQERLGQAEAGDSMVAEAVDIFRNAVGASHPMYFTALSSLANVRSRRGLHDEARPLFDEAITGMRRALGAVPELANTLSNYADMLNATGDIMGAEAAVAEALEIHRKAAGPAHPAVGVLTAQLGRLHCARDAFVEAGERFREALTVLGAALPPAHPRVIDVRGGFAVCLVRARRFEEAEALLVASFETLGGEAAVASAGPGPGGPRDVAARLVELYVAWGRPELAATYRPLAGPAQDR